MSVNSYYLVPVCEKIIVGMNCKIQIAEKNLALVVVVVMVVVVVVVWQFEESLPTYTLLADQLGLGQRPH